MSRIIEWDGQPFALLIEKDDGSYLVPPVVIDAEGQVVQGRETLEAIKATGTTVQLPVVQDATPGALADIDRRMATIAERLGVPIGPPK